MSITLDRPRSI